VVGGGTMASAEHEPITGVWEQIPQRGPGAEPLVRGSGGEAALKLKASWSLDVQRSRQIWPLSKNVLSNFVTRNKVLNHCRVIDAIQKVFMNVQSILLKRRMKFMRKFTEGFFGDVFG